MKFCLGEEVRKISNRAISQTGKSLWELPEYYLTVKLAEAVKKKNLAFDLEKNTSELELELNMVLPDDLRDGRIDLVVKTPIRGNILNLIEIKVRLGFRSVVKDVIRLADFAATSNKKSLKENYLIVVTRANENKIDERTKRFQEELDARFESKGCNLKIKKQIVIPIAMFKKSEKSEYSDEHVVVWRIRSSCNQRG